MKKFIFRGIEFRELKPFGLQAKDCNGKWHDTAFANKKALKQMTGVPDISLWKNKCVIGNLRFKD